MPAITIFNLINQELERQRNTVELIASENFVSLDILKAQGSICTNKYAEGYPGRRYYGGCEIVDQIETIAIDLAKKVFGAEHANVQPHSGSQANFAAYFAILEPGDKVLAMDLNAGGHLTHGLKINFSGKFYHFYQYGVDPTNEKLNYEQILALANEIKPKLIVAGASSYPRIIDFQQFRKIADAVGALLMVDMAHIAGLVATGLHPSPVPIADIVTTTLHKTMRGPRSGLILCKEIYKTKIDKAIFPGSQGGPLEHIIAAKAICLEEALQPAFKKYQKQVILNAKCFADEFKALGYKVISDGTDNHMVIINVKETMQLTGSQAEQILEKINITCNKNVIPNETEKPTKTSGIRIGTPAVTTRGLLEADIRVIVQFIHTAFQHAEDENYLAQMKTEIIAFMQRFPLYPNLVY